MARMSVRSTGQPEVGQHAVEPVQRLPDVLPEPGRRRAAAPTACPGSRSRRLRQPPRSRPDRRPAAATRGKRAQPRQPATESREERPSSALQAAGQIGRHHRPVEGDHAESVHHREEERREVGVADVEARPTLQQLPVDPWQQAHHPGAAAQRRSPRRPRRRPPGGGSLRAARRRRRRRGRRGGADWRRGRDRNRGRRGRRARPRGAAGRPVRTTPRPRPGRRVAPAAAGGRSRGPSRPRRSWIVRRRSSSFPSPNRCKDGPERPISRILFPRSGSEGPSRLAVIHLGPALPPASSDLPGSGPRRPRGAERGGTGSPRSRSPIWSCSAWGLPCPRPSPAARCALTAPFHPYRRGPEAAAAVYSLLHFPSRRRASPLASMLPVGVRTFLPAAEPGGAAARRPLVPLRQLSKRCREGQNFARAGAPS